MQLEPGVTPPVWAPIEVRLDPENKTLHIKTLDGHPLRGTNDFSFTDGEGGARMKQVSEFQFSSFAAAGGAAAMKGTSKDPLNRQHEIWNNAHAYMNDYAGR